MSELHHDPLATVATGMRGAAVSFRRPIAVITVLFALAGLTGVAAAGLAAAIPPAPPPITKMPTGRTTRCTMPGPGWSLWGIHTPNAPPLRGMQYLVTSWGIPCREAVTLVR